MTRPRIYNTEAVVLRTMPMGEADRLLTLFTPGWGKLQVTARGVRKTTSKLSGHLDVLTRTTLTLSHGQSLDTITSAEAIEAFIALKSNLSTVSHAIYLAELVDAFNPLEAPNEAAYTAFLSALHALEAPCDVELLLRFFELHTLEDAGFTPELERCAECSDSVLPNRHFFSPAGGGVVCPSCKSSLSDATPLSVDALKVLRYLSVSPLTAALKVNVRPALSRELAALMSSTLRHVLERELRSSSFLRTVDQLDALTG